MIAGAQAWWFRTPSRNTSAGVRHPRHLRGVALRRPQISFSSALEIVVGSVSRGSQRRVRRLRFSTVPFCQGEWGSSEPGLDAGAGLEVRPVDELGAAVEGDGAAGPEGQGAQHLGQPAHDRRRPAVRVRQKRYEAADALDQRGHVAPSEPTSEQQQIRLPMAELTPVCNVVGTEQDAVLRPELRHTGLAGTTWAALAALLGQMPPQALLHALLGVDEPVDRLLADPRLDAFQPQPSGDLFRGPTSLDPVDDLVPEIGVTDQLAVPGSRRTTAFILATIQ